MSNAWTDHGPISLPSRPLAYGAGFVVVVFAVAGLALGFQTALRKVTASELASGAGQGAGKDDAILARPIVDLTPATGKPAAPKDDGDNADADADKADALASETAAAQAIQSKPSKSGANIDDVLTSPTEKPPAPAKAATDEAPPGTPVKSDVPF